MPNTDPHRAIEGSTKARIDSADARGAVKLIAASSVTNPLAPRAEERRRFQGEDAESERKDCGDWWPRDELAAAARHGLSLAEFRSRRWESASLRETVKSLAEAKHAGRIGPGLLALLNSVDGDDWDVVDSPRRLHRTAG